MTGAAYLRRVRGLPCCARNERCFGPVDAHHAGARPGVGLKASDFSAIPLCRAHHDAWHAARDPFDLPKANRRAWADARIEETQRHLLGATPPTGSLVAQGERHPAWKGDAATTTTKRERAQRRYQLGQCERCLKPATDRHHRDGDTGNNAPSNVELLCRRCHMIVDGRLSALRNRPRRRLPPRACRVCQRLEPPRRMWRDRCHRCHEYWRRHGVDRPWGSAAAPRGGEHHSRVKLTKEQVAEIRASAEGHAAIARRFGVARSTIYSIRSGRNWRNS